ncbi:MAG TPA: hypothetical protein VG389_03055, partial [Myxococcota bacterium]|nr:hypothetical protein [Myxococcota bacterium]
GAVGVAPVAGGLVAATLPPIAAHLAVSPAVPLPTVPPASVPSRVVMSVPSVVLTAVPAVAPAAAPAVAPAAVPAAATEMLLRHPFEEDASLEPVGAPPDHIIGDDLVGVLNALFAALEGAVGPMADFVLRDALGAIGVSGEAPPDAMSRDDLRRLVDAAADSVPSSRRADFRARLHAALDDDDGDDLDEEDGDAGA